MNCTGVCNLVAPKAHIERKGSGETTPAATTIQRRNLINTMRVEFKQNISISD